VESAPGGGFFNFALKPLGRGRELFMQSSSQRHQALTMGEPSSKALGCPASRRGVCTQPALQAQVLRGTALLQLAKRPARRSWAGMSVAPAMDSAPCVGFSNFAQPLGGSQRVFMPPPLQQHHVLKVAWGSHPQVTLDGPGCL